MPLDIIATDQAPAAIGPYSQAVRAGNTVYFSGQTPLDPATRHDPQVPYRVPWDGCPPPGRAAWPTTCARVTTPHSSRTCAAGAAGGSLAKIVRVGIYVTDLANFAAVNAVMAEYFKQPYPARSTIEVSALPKAVQVEIDAVMVLD